MTFADLKAQHPIAEVVGQYVQLREKGRYLLGRCPFHDDKGRPNMVVFPNTNTFKCFACGAMGDILDFVSRIESISTAEAAKRIEGMKATVPHLPPPAKVERADNETVDRTYRALLAKLVLSKEHRNALERRGLSPEVIAEAGYRSYPLAVRRRVIGELLSEGFHLDGVPGFARSRRWSEWRLYGPEGLLIPVRDLRGRIQGLQVHSDQIERGRYRWLSTPETERRSGGASSGAPCHVAGRRFLGERPTLWITEGPLKADVAAHRLSALVLGVAGVANWRKALPMVEAIRPAQVILAFDQDEREETRRAVERNLAAVSEALAAMRLRVLTASWKQGKGIDDALALRRAVIVREMPTKPRGSASSCPV